MKTLAIILCALCLCLTVLAANALADTAEEARAAIRLWAPMKVAHVGNVLIVVLNERQVTPEIYRAVMLFGLCGSVQTGNTRLDGVATILILNLTGFKGWVFEGGAPECRKLGELTSSAVGLQLMGMTHLY